MPAHKFKPEPSAAEVQRDTLARAMREIMEALRRSEKSWNPPNRRDYSEIAAKAQRALMEAGLFP